MKVQFPGMVTTFKEEKDPLKDEPICTGGIGRKEEVCMIDTVTNIKVENDMATPIKVEKNMATTFTEENDTAKETDKELEEYDTGNTAGTQIDTQGRKIRQKRWRCGLCNWKSQRKGSVKCHKCNKVLCKGHISKTFHICTNCDL